MESVFSHVTGVRSAVAGYHGGSAGTADYDRVSSGMTRHAEAVRVVYDPAVVRYDELLRIFFSVVADPTQRNRQGPDRGPQFRTALVPLDGEQRAVAAAYLDQMSRSGPWSAPVVAQVEPHRAFYPAEAEHQDFARRNPQHRYVMRHSRAKVRALAARYPEHYRERPAPR